MSWLRTAEPADRPELERMLWLVERMLWLAVHWDAVEAPPRPDPLPPGLGRYLAGFGTRAGDFGVVAEDDLGTAGAAWYRLFGADEPATAS